MKVRYSKKRLRLNYTFGLYSLIAGALMIIASTIFSGLNGLLDSLRVGVGIGSIAGGIFSLVIFYYEKQKQYLKIENNILIKNTLFPKKINLNEVKQIKKFAGDYKLKTNKTEFIIDSQIIDPNSLTELNAKLEKLNIEWN